MVNPYEIMYDAIMDVYRYAEITVGNYTKHERVLVAQGRPCRYSSTGQVAINNEAAAIQNSHKLFCGLDEDIHESDHVEITLRTGKRISAELGECHPYSFQWQCEVERSGNA